MTKVYCENCIHFRSAPFEARLEGCYEPKLIGKKQKARFNDEQQLPGNHLKLNHKHDCEKYAARERKPSLWERLISA